ncbi:MAG: hypothetical protein KDA99_21915, partial [Planctomycetales bacterium]|nr:hypothetical protein [Planctomycetales bacterium]
MRPPQCRKYRIGRISAQLARLLCTCTAVILSCGTVHGSHIDYVSDGGFLLFTDSLSGPAHAVQTGDAGNIIGSERDVTISFSSGSGILGTAVLVPPGPGPVGPNTGVTMLMDNSVDSVGKLEIVYDGPGATGLGGIDFTNEDAISVLFEGVQGAGTLTVHVADTAANSGSMSLPVTAPGAVVF